jgi:hypothetical protein
MNDSGFLALIVKYRDWSFAARIVDWIAQDISDKEMPGFIELFKRLPLEVITILQDESSVPYLRKFAEQYIDYLVSAIKNADHGN